MAVFDLLKAFVMPAMLLLSRKIPFTVPNPAYICDEDGVCPDDIPKELNNDDLIQKSQMGLVCVVVLMMTILFYTHTCVKQNADGKKNIWVPPKTANFFFSAPKPVTDEDFKETTLGEHEANLVREQAQGMIMALAMAFFMSLKFNVHQSLVVQAVDILVKNFDTPVVKKYIFCSQNGEGETTYNELYTKPTKADIEAFNDKQGAASSDANTETTEVIKDEDEPPVVNDKQGAASSDANSETIEVSKDEVKTPVNAVNSQKKVKAGNSNKKPAVPAATPVAMFQSDDSELRQENAELKAKVKNHEEKIKELEKQLAEKSHSNAK